MKVVSVEDKHEYRDEVSQTTYVSGDCKVKCKTNEGKEFTINIPIVFVYARIQSDLNHLIDISILFDEMELDDSWRGLIGEAEEKEIETAIRKEFALGG